MEEISLAKKGDRIDLTKNNPSLKKGVIIGLGWDTNQYDTGHEFDLDASAFLLNKQGKALTLENFIFYNNLVGGNGSVVHSGDNQDGSGDGDDEEIQITFERVPLNIEKIAIAVTIHDAANREQNFGMVTNAYLRIVEEATGREILRYELTEKYYKETALSVCEFYRDGDEWKFNAIGNGFNDGLYGLARNYGLPVKKPS